MRIDRPAPHAGPHTVWTLFIQGTQGKDAVFVSTTLRQAGYAVEELRTKAEMACRERFDNRFPEAVDVHRFWSPA